MNVRDFAQQAIYKIIDPLVHAMIKAGMTPNTVTAIGLGLNMVSCAVFIYGATHGERGDFSYVGWGGALILFAGLFDMLDGQVARLGKMSSPYGALFDSVLDRYSELIVFFGICYYLILQGYFFSSLFAFIALIGSMMVSYVRARAEGLGIECSVGFMQRPERVVITALGAISCGIIAHFMGGDYQLYISLFQQQFLLFEPVLALVIPVAFVAVFSNITAINRMRHCKKALQEQDKTNNEINTDGA